MRTSLAACIVLGCGAAGAAVVPDLRKPSAAELADRVQNMVVQVVASEDGQPESVASGVLAGGGIVLTDLRAVVVRVAGGGVGPARSISVETAKGVFAAHVAAISVDLDVAVLRLSDGALALEGPPLAEEPPGEGDALLAIRASRRGGALAFEALDFFVQRTEGDPTRLSSTPPLPVSFAGAPIFDDRGGVAALLVATDEQHGLLVPALFLRQILARVRGADPAADDHI